jgi:hypothetical protein
MSVVTLLVVSRQNVAWTSIFSKKIFFRAYAAYFNMNKKASNNSAAGQS